MKRDSAAVVQELLNEMKRSVVSYPETLAPTPSNLEELIAGTAFFPGGTGLWRGQEAGGSLPLFFPEEPVMFIARDFGDIASFDEAKRDRGEAHRAFATLWSNLLDFISNANGLAPSQCFFTNAYMGLRLNGRSGDAPTSAEFSKQCAKFLASQSHVVAPKAVVLLGDSAEALWRTACKLDPALRAVPAKKIMHPSAPPLNQNPSPAVWKANQGLSIAELLAMVKGALLPSANMNDTQQLPATKMWSGRFREPLDPTFESWQRSFPFDWRLLPQEIAASKAHARAIAAAGILTESELAPMLDGLDQVLAQTTVTAAVVAEAPEAEDIHHFTELQLTRLIGPLALKLHTGRSRNEQIATDMRLFVREAIDRTLDGLRDWREALITLGEQAGDATMPSYTHLQRAEPVLVAHWLLAYVAMIERDASRLTDARRRMNLCPLGSGAVAGATLALDRTIAAKALGFDGPTPNSMDATSDRDSALEFTQAVATLGIHISRFAEELTLYSTAEFGFLDLPERFSTGSSAMPQKKNPDLTELIRGKSGRLLGASVTLATLIKGLPLAYNKDLQEGQEPVFDAADTIAGILSVLPGFTRALKFRLPQMKRAAESGYLNAMAAATYLSNKGVPFRKAHEQIGHAVRFGLESGRELGELTLAELRAFGDEFAEDFFEAITLEATLDCHDVIGGTARHRVRAALEAARRRIVAEADHSAAESEKLE